MTRHDNYRFCVTLHSDDLAVVNCLRALTQFSQHAGNNRIPWGGTKDTDWERDHHRVTFHFSEPRYRQSFLDDIARLLPRMLWRKEGVSDDDPAKPQG